MRGDGNWKGCCVDKRGKISKDSSTKWEVGKWGRGCPFLLGFLGEASEELVNQEIGCLTPKAKGLQLGNEAFKGR